MAAIDLALSRSFRLSNFPCWWKASTRDIALAQWSVDNVLQPVVDRWGAVAVSSWRWWRTGCVPRVGGHADGGTLDLVPLDATIDDVFGWMVSRVPYGELIHERDHIHVTHPGVGEGSTGPEALLEIREGVYVPYVGASGSGIDSRPPGADAEGWGGYGSPIPIAGIEVEVSQDRWATAAALLAALLVLSRRTRDGTDPA